MVREGAFKLVAAKEPFEATHLFDLESDPYEMNNLLDNSDHADTQNHLLQTLQTWYERVKAEGPDMDD